jgi:hypothetical protein
MIIPRFNIELYIHACDDLSSFLSRIGKQAPQNSVACTYYDWDSSCKLRIHAAFNKRVQYSTMVHESVHVVNIIFESKGVKPDLSNDELQAYLTAYVFKKVSSTMKKCARCKRTCKTHEKKCKTAYPRKTNTGNG